LKAGRLVREERLSVTILAIHAHPDDVETVASGALAILAARGCRIWIVTATAGEAGSRQHGPEALASIRRQEARTAAALIGADYACLGYPDLGVFSDDASRRTMTEMIRAVAPDVVLAPSPFDYHPDHEAASVLARDACFAASVPNYLTGPAPPLDSIPALYFMDAIGGRDREGRRIPPDFGVDVNGVMAIKRRMLAAHASQTAWVADQHGVPDLVEAMESWSARRGRDFGCAFAEGFQHYRGHPYPAEPRLQTLLGDSLASVKA
jgi:LmbE family N-acetylglucosaminyl deacetylase